MAKKKKLLRHPYLFEEILKLLKRSETPMNYKQIASRMGIKNKKQKVQVGFVLQALAKKGAVQEIKKGKFVVRHAHPEWQAKQPERNTEVFTGIVDMTASGSSYIICERRETDIYISRKNSEGLMDGDKVRVRLIRSRRRGREEGVIEKIIERARTEFVGTVQISNTEGGSAFLLPDNSKVSFDIYIPRDKIKNAKDGQKAVAKITVWESGRKNPQGEIIKVLGNAGEHETEMHAILAEFGLPAEFPDAVIRQANSIPADTTIPEEEIVSRKDFRTVPTFTIDPMDAKDFDDAISVQKLTGGLWEIGVHIADVTHYVKENTLLDKEAYQRGTSVYLVDRVVPMFPENISNVLCSLRPNEDKLCFSAVFEMDENAAVHKKWFGKTVIRSAKRFTYEEAQQVIETGKGIFANELLLLNSLARKLREERLRKGSIAFEKAEVKFHLDEAGNPTGIFFKEMKDSNKLIEEFMLLANKAVAEFCNPRPHQDRDGRSVFVYRVHDKPDKEKLLAFAAIASRFGYKINLKNKKTIAETMNKTLKDCAGKPEANMIEMLAIRSMAKATYTTKNIGHYGLGFTHYTHFTSPIRRYPDILVHRLLARQLFKTTPETQGHNFLEDQCRHSSQREKLAEEAERASVKYKQVQYLEKKIGETFEGMISGVTEWGIFVELDENHCEGLVRMKDVREDYFVYDEKNFCYTGRKTGMKYALGDKVRVKVKKVDLSKKQVDFVLEQGFVV